MYKTNRRRSKDGEKSDGLGALGPKEQHDDKFPVFFTPCSYILRLGAKEAGNPEMPKKERTLKKKKKKENLLSLAIECRKAQPNKAENF